MTQCNWAPGDDDVSVGRAALTHVPRGGGGADSVGGRVDMGTLGSFTQFCCEPKTAR